MTPTEYMQRTGETDLYQGGWDERLVAYTFGVISEAGEVAGKYKNYLRGDYDNHVVVGSQEILRDQIILEIGDVLWYTSRVLSLLDTTFEEVMENNIIKLTDRAKRDVIRGSGDDR